MKNARTNVDVVRAWKDPAYRATLSTDELSRIPASPVGMSELDPNVLGDISGGDRKHTRWGSGCRKSKSWWLGCGKEPCPAYL